MPSQRRCVALLLILTVLLSPPRLWLACAATAAEPSGFTEADLEALLARNPDSGKPVDGIAELLPLLPPALRANFTFVYQSRSPFRASISPEHPRVILFTPDARLIVAFTGDPDKAGADGLETVAFDDAAAAFRLRAFVLPAAARSGSTQPSGTADCASCHGADARPIYDSYPLWPGFYGSALDTFPRDRRSMAERQAYAAFWRDGTRRGVYAALIFGQASPTAPYLDPRRFHDDTADLSAAAFPFLPNTRLGMALTGLNRQRLYHKLKAGPGFAAQEKPILAELLGCRGSEQPDRAARAAIATRLETENAARLRRLGVAPGKPHPGFYDMQELSFIRPLATLMAVAQRASVDPSDWSMALEPGRLSFFDGILSGIHAHRSYYLVEDLFFEVLEHLAAREPAFGKTFAIDPVFEDLHYPFGHRIDIG